MGDPSQQPTSSYLQYLPAVLQEGPFIGPFLLGFEAVLSGYIRRPTGVKARAGLEKVLDSISDTFDPWATEPEFLPWLAQWVALGLRADWSEQTKRELIASVVPLYHLRGTKRGLQKALDVCLPDYDVTIVEPGAPAHYFEVQLVMTTRDDEALQRAITMIETVVNQQKPAHTTYALAISYPAMQIADDPKDGGIIVATNTTLGSATPEESPSSGGST
jgi:phage tail-like protein